jgi:tRNA(Ile)-lysidine synthetase-like protein
MKYNINTVTPDRTLHDITAAVPAGRWAVAVSGGADSAALLRLLVASDASENPARWQVVHLDHETRQGESAIDAAFVADLSHQLNVPCTITRRSDIEPHLHKLPANRSARFRAVRFELFRRVVQANALEGVILAHHAGDQAETIFLRLLRGAGPTALAGMSPRTTMAGITVLRPMLGVTANQLRDYLREIGQTWREDSSNTSPKYLRNRVRPILADDAELRESLLELGRACGQLRSWLSDHCPKFGPRLRTDELADLPGPVARHAAAKWLVQRGVPIAQIDHAVCDRLIQMADDAATSSRQTFPGNITIRRKRGELFRDG